ncbi:MAG: transposase [Acidobacteriota bacterium]|nr:transposase [Acidobacteriota bacterium]
MEYIEGDILSLDVDSIDLSDPEQVRELIRSLISIIEMQAQVIKDLREENQQLKDEIAYLKGEKGKPKIKPNVPEKPPKPDSRVADKPKKWTKKAKNPRIKIDRVERLYVDKTTLPPDAVRNGFRTVIKQDIKIETNNVEYQLEQYYSPSSHKVYEADLPEDVQKTEFGSTLKAFVIGLHYVGRVPQNKIKEILENIGVIISEGTISNILTKEKHEVFTAEKEAIFEAGMKNADYFQIDDTGARHMGTNQYLDVVCNDQFSYFFVLDSKRKDALRSRFGLEEGEQIDIPMVSDAAPQFFSISSKQGLCWIHEMRHYKKLTPIFDQNKSVLDNFKNKLYNYYDLLKQYKEAPDKGLKIFIGWLFDSIFLPTTGYIKLDETIRATIKRRDKLLRVLDYPVIPLHNNGAEIALRGGVLKRKISYGTRSELGKISWENFFTILDTCRKQKVSFLKYVKDIISNKRSMPWLFQLLVKDKGSMAY